MEKKSLEIDAHSVERQASVPIAVAVSDLHLTAEVPGSVRLSRQDWHELQWGRVAAISALAETLGVPVLVGGDFFDTARQITPAFFGGLLDAISSADTLWITVAGQHDLPYHSLERIDDCWLYNLHHIGHVLLLHGDDNVYLDVTRKLKVHGFSWGASPLDSNISLEGEYLNVALSHRMVYHKMPPYPGCPEESNLDAVAKEYAGFDYSVYGDNHKSFMRGRNGCVHLNCGCLFPRTTAEAEYPAPRAWILHCDQRVEYEQFGTPYEIISSQRVVGKGEFTAFVEQLDGVDGNSFESFEQAVKQYCERNSVRNEIRSYILDVCADVRGKTDE